MNNSGEDIYKVLAPIIEEVPKMLNEAEYENDDGTKHNEKELTKTE